MIVLTMGTFDLFHVGHVNLLRECKEHGTVVVALNTDEFVREFKGEYPIVPFTARRDVLLACKHVDVVMDGASSHDTRSIIEAVKPDMIVVGSDWAAKDYYSQIGATPAWLAERNIELKFVPYTPGISSTNLRKHLCD